MKKETMEVEIKVKIGSIEQMITTLEEAGAKFQCDLVHEDYYLDLPEKLGSFAKTDEALRIRNSMNKTTNEHQYFLTYKGKKIDTTSKTRHEIDIKIDNGQDMLELFKKLKFQEVIKVRKERKIFKLEDISITLDKVELLQDKFMEVEILTNNEQVDAARKKLFKFLADLGFDEKDSIQRSYLELILQARGILV
ncbi:MAG: class IV adenylate cyclase [Promethearchaeota archaeon]